MLTNSCHKVGSGRGREVAMIWRHWVLSCTSQDWKMNRFKDRHCYKLQTSMSQTNFTSCFVQRLQFFPLQPSCSNSCHPYCFCHTQETTESARDVDSADLWIWVWMQLYYLCFNIISKFLLVRMSSFHFLLCKIWLIVYI